MALGLDDTIKATHSTDMYRTFIPGIAPSAIQSGPTWWFVGSGCWFALEGTVSQIPRSISLTEIGLVPVRTQYLGTLDDQPCYSAAV